MTVERRRGRDQSFGIVPFRRVDGELLFLLIQHNAGHWAFPKGHAEGNETPIEAALRELREEAGIADCRPFPEVHFSETYTIRRPTVLIDKTVTYFPAEVDDPRVRLQVEEVQAYAWMPYETALQRITFAQAQQVLRKVHEFVLARESGGGKP